MDIFNYKKKKIPGALCAIVLCGFMVFMPEDAILSTKKAISIWAGTIVPAMFPFLICAGFLTSLDAGKYINRSLFVFMMSVLSGYPTGAKVISDMIQRKEIDTEEGEYLISFSSTAGPAFIIGVVGVGMFDSFEAGIVMAVSHYVAAVICGFIMSKFKKKTCSKIVSSSNYISDNRTFYEVLTDSIFGALKSSGIILAYLVMFMLIIEVIEKTSNLSAIGNDETESIIKGIIEMTVGCMSVSGLTAPTNVKVVAGSFLISFGGLSVIGQTMSMLAGTGISISYVLYLKVLHGLIAATISTIMVIII